MRRAAHQLLDQPLVFEDALALRVLGPEREAALRADPDRFENGVVAPYLRAFFAARSRVAEDTLAHSADDGTRQYVVLGAGLDTFAYRSPYPPERLRVFEVDHPATQAWKRRVLAEAGIGLPSSLTFVPVDFERQSLRDELAAAGFEPDAGGFFSWLGVVPYLEERSVWDTLRNIAALTAHGGGVIFDYGVPPATLSAEQRAVFDIMAERVRAAGEPWRTFFVPEELETRLRMLGFREMEDLDGAALNRRYFRGRGDGLRVGGMGHIVRATNPRGAGRMEAGV